MHKQVIDEQVIIRAQFIPEFSEKWGRGKGF